jgi:ribonuclease HI
VKKKYLNSLIKIESYLQKQNLYFEAEESAVRLLRSRLEEVIEEDSVEDEALKLSAPKELQDSPIEFALYADGACKGNPGVGAMAYVMQSRAGEILVEGVEYESFTTNNKMELRGVIEGLRESSRVLTQKGLDSRLLSILVVTDSKYVVEGMKQWVKGWKARGWKKADNKTPENLELWQSLDEVKDSFFHVEWMWVKGHAGHVQNEYCDRKANDEINRHS